jgi:AcrR family transcriptional regulator
MVLRVKPEKKEERERIASALLRATVGLAAAHGFSSLGLREVARAADIAPTSFYRHFADMEALGLTLIEDLVGDLVEDWVERARENRTAHGALGALAREALAIVSADPELMRFILAERVGAIASFRAALRKKLGILWVGVSDALATDLSRTPASVPPWLVHAAVALLLETCSDALEEGPDRTPALIEPVMAQVRVLLAGASQEP